VLTKPIGSGVLTSAAKARKIEENELAEAVEVMVELNAGAAEAALEVGARGVTDITGFGLIGHAFELAEASGVSVELVADKVPLLEQTLALAKQNIVTRAHKSNLEHLGDRFATRGVDETLVAVLADAQTSGGLLIAVTEDRADELIEKLRQRRTKAAHVVGRVGPKAEVSVTLT
jgi:selenide,water dikinase